MSLFLIGAIVTLTWTHLQLWLALGISLVFYISLEVLDVIMWKHYATKSPEYLPNFFLGFTGIRMFLVLITMMIVYLLSTREEMLRFFCVFGIFYVVILVHHTSFFRSILKNDACKLNNNPQE